MLTIEDGIVFKTSSIGGAVFKENINPVVMVKIEETETLQIYSWVKFNPETEAWEADPINTDPVTADGVEYGLINGCVIIPIIPEPISETPTLEEMQMQTLLNTEYLVIMSELSNL